MPELEYFLVCESVAIDKDTNRISLFHVLEQIRRVQDGEPARLISGVTAVCCWYGVAEDANQEFQAKLRIVPPDGEILDFPMNFQMNSRRQRLVFYLQGVPSLEEGDLRFEMWLNGEYKAKHIVTVQPATTPPADPSPVR